MRIVSDVRGFVGRAARLGHSILNMHTTAIIPARGESKGIPHKNIVDFCGKPLVVWSIEQALGARGVDSVWVSSDDPEILRVSEQAGARTILRPAAISGDLATSESAWLHAIDAIVASGVCVDRVVAMQATSPIREASDIDGALEMFRQQSLDSLFSASKLDDFFIWEKSPAKGLESLNYDWRNRKRRQDLEFQQYVENGSFYIFTPDLLRRTGNRLGGKIGLFEMAFWKCFEINTREDLKLCASVMQSHLLEIK